MRRTLLPALFAAMLLARAADAQAQRNEATLEASFVRGAIGYARHTAPRVLVGVELGFGFPQLDRTLRPERDEATGSPDFEEYLHLGVFVRYKVSDNFDVDTGLRASIVDLYPCSSSDCWPETFAGAYIQPMVGWRHVKVGTRLTAGWVGEQDERGPNPEGSTFTVGLAPFLVRATLPW